MPLLARLTLSCTRTNQLSQSLHRASNLPDCHFRDSFGDIVVCWCAAVCCLCACGEADAAHATQGGFGCPWAIAIPVFPWDPESSRVGRIVQSLHQVRFCATTMLLLTHKMQTTQRISAYLRSFNVHHLQRVWNWSLWSTVLL